jgi:opacity protein-like surface antigen
MKIPGILKIMLAFILAAGVTAGVRADSDVAPQELSLEAGAAFPTGVNHFSDQEKIGLIGGVRYLRMITSKFGWGVQADYYHFAAKTHPLTDQYGAQLNARSWDNVATAEIMGRYSILPDARVVPYLHSGVGVTYFHQISEGAPLGDARWSDTGTAETRHLLDTSSVGFSYSAGFGVETNLTNSLVLGLETAWRIFGVSQTSFGTSAINVPSVSLRLGWRFGHFATDTFTNKPAS